MTSLPHVALRPQTLDDAEMILRWRSDPEILSQLFSERPPTLEEHRRWFAGLGDDRKEYIILAEGTHPIGTVGLSRIDLQSASAEYGILMGERDYWGRGYAAAASRELLRIGFRELGLKRVYLCVFEDNRRAISLYTRLGFRREPLACEPVRKNGVLRTVVSMAITAEQWNPLAPS